MTLKNNMKTFKEYNKEPTKELQELGPIASAVVLEVQEFIWKVLVLTLKIVKFLVENGIKTLWGGSKLLYKRYNKQGRSDARFNRQMRQTNKQVRKLRIAKDGYLNAVYRLENMKGALESMSKEEKMTHKQELNSYYKKIAELQKQANEAVKKLRKVA